MPLNTEAAHQTQGKTLPILPYPTLIELLALSLMIFDGRRMTKISGNS
jgi:hypothetical protein